MISLVSKILYEAFIKKSVKSSNIYAIGYDEKTQILRIIFKSKATYDYYNVPERVWKQLKKTKSKGQFAYYNICYEYYYERID